MMSLIENTAMRHNNNNNDAKNCRWGSIHITKIVARIKRNQPAQARHTKATGSGRGGGMTAPGEASVVSEKIRHGYIDDLVHWRVPWASGCVLALGLLFFVLTDIFGYAYTALLCMMALVHLLVSAMYSFVQQWNGASVDDWTARFKIDGDEASRIGRRVALEYNAVVDWYCHLAAARDLKMLGMVIAVLFVMWILANVFSDSGLCLIGERAHAVCAERKAFSACLALACCCSRCS